MRIPLLLALLAGTPLVAQETALTVPVQWKVRADRGTVTVVPDADLANPRTDVRLVTMPPGWHITTGPAVIAYDPAWVASGSYRVEMESFLFPGERQEGFGLFVGGRDLEGDDQTYLYVLLRKDGQLLVKRRQGAETPTIIPWMAHPAVVPQTEGTAKNVLAVDVAADSVRVFVNDRQVTALARASLPTNGQVGLRVNHALNLHVTRVEITKKQE
ncbi:MAG: hypothetical protein OEW06_17630 [Gemmatimonadota bacterium]|nr:hypothetical protein [Gemmatimonadota bacterium]